MSDYRSVRKDIAERMGDTAVDPGDEIMQCSYCKAPTKRSVLSFLGARCQRCYDSYCSDPISYRYPMVGAVNGVPVLHQWAYRLMAKRTEGKTLSDAQAHCLREFERRDRSEVEDTQ